MVEKAGAMVDLSQGILTRDEVDCEEHYLKVIKHPTGLIVIRDDEISRVIAPPAAWELCFELVKAISLEPRAQASGGSVEMLLPEWLRKAP